jgi:hypothetical protein
MIARLKASRYLLTLCGFATLPLQPARDPAPARVTAVRLTQNPLITVASSPSLGDNVNGPSIIRAPSWIPRPLGRYYAYFGHHKGQFIRLAYADAIVGPWKVYEPGVEPVAETAFYRPQLRPEAPYECPGLPSVPSAAGEIEGPARQLRDPAIFEEAGRTYLFYAICGEQGLAAAELRFR